MLDSLGSDRCYKKAWPIEKVNEYILEQREKQFDPKLVDILMENIDKVIAIKDEYKDEIEYS